MGWRRLHVGVDLNRIRWMRRRKLDSMFTKRDQSGWLLLVLGWHKYCLLVLSYIGLLYRPYSTKWTSLQLLLWELLPDVAE